MEKQKVKMSELKNTYIGQYVDNLFSDDENEETEAKAIFNKEVIKKKKKRKKVQFASDDKSKRKSIIELPKVGDHFLNAIKRIRKKVKFRKLKSMKIP